MGHLAAFCIQSGPEVAILTHVANNLQNVLRKVAQMTLQYRASAL